MKVLLVSGSRADYGCIKAVHDAFRRYQHIKADLIRVEDWKGEEGRPYNPVGIDIAILVGDRSEILDIAVDIYTLGIPIAHLSGGDITEGSMDDCMRHAITKLSHLHFPTTYESAKRIIQMGEEPWRVRTVGCPASDSAHIMDPVSLQECKNAIGITRSDYALVIWHPDTLANEESNKDQVRTLTSSLEEVPLQYLIIGPNKDLGSDIVREQLKAWAEKHNHPYRDEGFERTLFSSLLNDCKCLIGNSSAGIFEAPTFGTPVVNIGDRQKGRIKATNVIDSSLHPTHIASAIRTQLRNSRYVPDNPYKTGRAADRIAEEISKIFEPKKLLKKKFHQL